VFTIFARHLDNFIMIPNLSSAYKYRKPGLAKIAPWCLARRDNLSAKVPGPVAGVTAPPTLSAHTRNRCMPFQFLIQFLILIRKLMLLHKLNLIQLFFATKKNLTKPELILLVTNFAFTRLPSDRYF